jgi:hypothetical protein
MSVNVNTMLGYMASRVRAQGDRVTAAMLETTAEAIANSALARAALADIGFDTGVGTPGAGEAPVSRISCDELEQLGRDAVRGDMNPMPDDSPVGDQEVWATNPMNGAAIRVRPVVVIGVPTASSVRARCIVVGQNTELIIHSGHVQGAHRDRFKEICKGLARRQGLSPEKLVWASDGKTAAEAPPA